MSPEKMMRAPFAEGYSELCAIALERVVGTDRLSSLAEWPDGLGVSAATYSAEVRYDYRDGYSYFEISVREEGDGPALGVLDGSALDWRPAPESSSGISAPHLFMATSGPHPEVINPSIVTFFDDLAALGRGSDVPHPHQSAELGPRRFPLKSTAKTIGVLRRAGYQRRQMRVDWASGRVVVQTSDGLADARIGLLPKGCLLVRFIPRSGRTRVVEPWVAEDLMGRQAAVTLASIENDPAMRGCDRRSLEEIMRSLESLAKP